MSHVVNAKHPWGVFTPAKRQPKTYLAYIVQGNYGFGWEDVSEVENMRELRAELRTYCENEPQFPHRMITRRTKREAAQ